MIITILINNNIINNLHRALDNNLKISIYCKIKINSSFLKSMNENWLFSYVCETYTTHAGVILYVYMLRRV